MVRTVAECVGEILLRLVPVEELADPLLDVGRTPGRVERAYAEILSGYAPGAVDLLRASFTVFMPEEDAPRPGGIVTVAGIPFTSLCAHHMLPFTGTMHVSYIPNQETGAVVGLSKIPRVVEHYSRQLQLQERLTTQVAGFLLENLDPSGLLVVSEARHECMEIRGVRSVGSVTRYADTPRGLAGTPSIRDEMYRLMGL